MNLYCGTSINPDTILSHNLIITVFFIFALRLLDEFYILKRLVLSTVLKVVICRFIWRWIMSKLVDTKKIGEGIKKLRIKRNLTQEFLASSVGYSTRSIRRIETQGTDSKVWPIFSHSSILSDKPFIIWAETFLHWNKTA